MRFVELAKSFGQKNASGGGPPHLSARDRWPTVVAEISARWESARRRLGENVPWLAEDIEERLSSAVGDALRASDEERAEAAIGAWMAAWLAILEDAGCGKSGESGKSPDYTEDESDLTGGRSGKSGESLPASQRESLAAVARREDGVTLFDWLDSPDFTEAEKEVFRGALLDRADLMIAEGEGRIPHPNQGVWDMHTEARERLGSRDLEGRSITARLKKHAPEVTVIWPDAPLEASWIDWRSRLKPAEIPSLDKAWQEACLKRGESK